MKSLRVFAGLILLAVFAAGCPEPKVVKKFPPLFNLAYILDAGAEPSYMITEDFDKDGKQDLVVTNSGDRTFSFFKGLGDGSFQDQIVFKTGQDPICVTAGLFNYDAFPDIAVLNYADQSIHIYLNTKTGSFKNTGKFLYPGKIPINMVAGDFNRDGISDLIVTMRYHKVVVYLGKGNGNFSEPVSLPVNGQPTGVVIGDYNHDKLTDVAIALAGSGNTGVQILWGKGDGTFNTSKRFRGGGQPLTIVNVDMDGDGFDDLVTSSNALHALTAVHNNGDETFSSLKDFASGSFPKFVAVADFTGDGIADLAVSNSTDDLVSVSLGNGDGTFVYPPIFQPVDEYPQGMVTGDFNGDGLMDLAVSCRDKGHIDILLKRNMVNPQPEGHKTADLPKNPTA